MGVAVERRRAAGPWAASALARALAVVLLAAGLAPADPLAWPPATRDSRPWTRWWWLGSAVDEPGLTRELELLAAAGFGGVEICPIYGVVGEEARAVPFLSPRFVALVAHASAEARRLGMAVDLTTGTGWPFGGPTVSGEDAASALVVRKLRLAGGAAADPDALGGARIVAAMAVADGTGERLDLGNRAGPDGRLLWTVPKGQWSLYAALLRGTGQKVKRAAPGGEGLVLDPYAEEALARYLAGFDAALGPRASAPELRAQFHDSFEYYGASGTPGIAAEFARRSGYPLRDALPALAGDGVGDVVARVQGDYRRTLAALHLAYVRRWASWSRGRGNLSRNQAHGGPANLLDVYAAADIPETEVFGQPDEAQVPRLKLASSAAHLTGRALAAAEAFTWLGEHFQVPLWRAKEAADWLFLAGVNHLVYHGVPYSPADAEWPGWQFYASVNFGPRGGLWRDMPQLGAYVARCQSVLQAGVPDADVLLYHSPDDAWDTAGELLLQNPVPKAFEEAGLRLWQRGFQWDAVSDALLETARADGGRIRLGAGSYQVVLVPRVVRLAPAALRRLLQVAREGGRVAFLGGLPSDVPGLGALEPRRAELRALAASAGLDGASGDRPVGRGRVLAGDDVERLLAAAGVGRETVADAGLQLVRRRIGRDRVYFVVNRSARPFDAWAPLESAAASVVRLDPLAPQRTGRLASRAGPAGGTEVLLALAPGESAVLRAVEEPVSGPPWPEAVASGPAAPLGGTWSVEFVDGGPARPAGFEAAAPGSWTDRGDPEAQRFAGTARYTLAFERPLAERADDWLLDLGEVRDSARVRLNGRPVATVWSRPFRVRLGPLPEGRATLEVEVTNLAANRIRDLDLRGVRWKRFHDANVVGVDYKPLDASAWPVRASGLLGPVTLQPLACPRPAGARP
jgi:hypothetical protein